jgi:hypothetical protein
MTTVWESDAQTATIFVSISISGTLGTRIVIQTETTSSMQPGVDYYQYPQTLLSTMIRVSGGLY